MEPKKPTFSAPKNPTSATSDKEIVSRMRKILGKKRPRKASPEPTTPQSKPVEQVRKQAKLVIQLPPLDTNFQFDTVKSSQQISESKNFISDIISK